MLEIVIFSKLSHSNDIFFEQSAVFEGMLEFVGEISDLRRYSLIGEQRQNVDVTPSV